MRNMQRICLLTFPPSTIQVGIDCIDCEIGCYECVTYTYICTSCKTGY